jgi:outer membrane lipoprotein-sorting protein
MPTILRIAMLAFALTSLRAEALSDILARMDQAAVKFQSFSATTKTIDYTAVLDDKDDKKEPSDLAITKQTGVMRLKKTKGGMQGVVIFDEPNPRTIHFAGKTLQVYYPKANNVEIYDAGKHTNVIDEIILLGFGTSGAELRKNYQVTLAGTETLNGVQASRLELIPKSDEVRQYASKIELWIPEGDSNPIQEKVTQPNKDYHLVQFSDRKINPPIPDSDFSLKLPPGVKKVYPQK